MAEKTLRPPSKQKLLYRQAWLRAMASEDGLKLNFKTKAGAHEARRHLYEAVRDGKEFPMQLPELFKASEQIQIVWAGETSLWMRHRDKNDATTGLEEALGVHMADLVDTDMQAESSRLLGQLERMGLVQHEGAAPAPAPHQADEPDLGEHQDNPFYPKRS